jgi:hypothetical protein
MPASAMVNSSAANPGVGAAGRPQPQTTQEAVGGPFLRHAHTASRPGFLAAGSSVGVPGYFGSTISNPLPSAPGYLRYLDFQVSTSGSTSAGVSAYALDAPFNFLNLIQFKDPWGTPLLTGDGFSLLNLLHKYGGQGLSSVWPACQPASLPSYVTQTATGAGSGQFTFHSVIPAEGTKGYGCISIGNSSVMPSVLLSTSASTSVYTTPPATLPTSISVNVDEYYYDIDPSYPVVPPGNGTTFQTSVVLGNQSVAANASVRVQLPRTGGYLTNLILVARDSTNTRQDIWNSTGRIRLYVDGVPRFDENFTEMQDRMFAFSEGTTRDTGVICYNFKTSLSQTNYGLFDTLEEAMQTNPGTLLEIEMTPFGSGGTAPYQIQAIVTQLVPAGGIVQGLSQQ